MLWIRVVCPLQILVCVHLKYFAYRFVYICISCRENNLHGIADLAMRNWKMHQDELFRLRKKWRFYFTGHCFLVLSTSLAVSLFKVKFQNICVNFHKIFELCYRSSFSISIATLDVLKLKWLHLHNTVVQSRAIAIILFHKSDYRNRHTNFIAILSRCLAKVTNLSKPFLTVQC